MIYYRDATQEDMLEVARVHILTLPEYFTSTLGEVLLSKFYNEIYFSHLLSLGVLAEYRGQYIASRLIDEFESRMEGLLYAA